jgi:hypothetical protein
MAHIARLATNKLVEILTGSEGVPAAVAALSQDENLCLPAISPEQIIAQNASAELAERSAGSNYPLVYVYCNKVVNELREKFRGFSGDAEMVVEARVSQDRLEEMQNDLHSYVDAIVQVLADSRGDWGDGIFYGGGYQITFGGVRHGGRNFLQLAKISFVLEISAD